MFVSFVGPYLQRHASELRILGEAIGTEHGRLFLLADVTRGLLAGPDQHRFVAEQTGRMPLSGVTYFTQSPSGRPLGIMLESATRLYRGLRVPTFFAGSAEKARAWIDNRRRALLTPG